MIEMPAAESQGNIKAKLIGFKEAVELRGPSKPESKMQLVLKLTKPNHRHLPVGDPVGLVMHQAPEMICKDYNEKVDIWSIGVALYYMLSGEYPFADGDAAKLKFSILNGRYHFKRKPLP